MEEEQKQQLTKEEVIAWYKDQIELATLRADLAEQQSRAVRFESERLQHAIMIANIKAAKDEIDSEEEAPKEE